MLIVSLYTVLNFIFIGIAFGFGACFVFLSAPNSKSQNNYADSRKAMAIAYMSMGCILIMELFARPYIDSVSLIRLVTLILGSSQAFLFTYALTNLINVRSSIMKATYIEVLPIIILSVLGFISLFIPRHLFMDIIYCLFVAYYLSMLIRYILLFVINYKYFKQQTVTDLSGKKTSNLQWVVSFLIAVPLLGALAVISSLLSRSVINVISTSIFICFYTYFAIRFINYSYVFKEEKNTRTSTEGALMLQTPELPVMDAESARIPYDSILQLERQLSEWVDNKEYLKTGITIEQLASTLNTNRTYLSFYINKYQLRTFKEWINYLRIQEAQYLLLKYPDLSVSEVGVKVGYTDKSNFGKQFSKLMNITPQAWRRQNQEMI